MSDQFPLLVQFGKGTHCVSIVCSTEEGLQQCYNNIYFVLCFLPVHSGHQVRWTYQPGSHRRKVTQDFSSTFFLRCVP